MPIICLYFREMREDLTKTPLFFLESCQCEMDCCCADCRCWGIM